VFFFCVVGLSLLGGGLVLLVVWGGIGFGGVFGVDASKGGGTPQRGKRVIFQRRAFSLINGAGDLGGGLRGTSTSRG